MLSTSWLKGIKSKWNRNHHTEHGSAWIKTANSLIYCMLHQKKGEKNQRNQRITPEIKGHLPGRSANLCKRRALDHHQTYSSKNWQKRSKWKDLCSGMPKRDSCSRNQLFHLEILSLPWNITLLVHMNNFQTLSTLFRFSQRGWEHIRCGFPLLCKSDLNILHETCQCFAWWIILKSRYFAF